MGFCRIKKNIIPVLPISEFFSAKKRKIAFNIFLLNNSMDDPFYDVLSTGAALSIIFCFVLFVCCSFILLQGSKNGSEISINLSWEFQFVI